VRWTGTDAEEFEIDEFEGAPPEAAPDGAAATPPAEGEDA
jgi:hypothetical protein